MLFYGFSHLKDFAFTIRSFKWISPARRKPKISNWTGVRSMFSLHVGQGFTFCRSIPRGDPFGARVAGTSFVAGIRIIDDELCIFRMFQVLWQMFIFVLSSRLCKNDMFFLPCNGGWLGSAPEIPWGGSGFSEGSGPPKHWPQNLKIKCSDDFLQLLLVVD